jgi:hypothetical protein
VPVRAEWPAPLLLKALGIGGGCCLLTEGLAASASE